MAATPGRSDLCQTAPFTLFPSPFPKKLFREAMDIQQACFYSPISKSFKELVDHGNTITHAVNLLYFRASWDFDFLIEAHADVVRTDDFIRHFVDILKAVRDASTCQKKTLLIQRNDYMCHEDMYGNHFLRQVIKHIMSLQHQEIFELKRRF
ncbi:unnamed protein product [Gongylonema pulchrum]|uniref:ANF_receptor domain-containing protein n=1 Tax=Gongylonema pulchrum TaxID=637853 RepID=A0A183DFH3_9BILA|nr:unnamed protein product [Gongylonema pulchrum]